MDKRIVITGIGICTPLGLDRESFWNNIIEGKTSIKPFSEEISRNKEIAEILMTSNVKVASLFLREELTDKSLRLEPERLGYDMKISSEAQKYRGRFKAGEHFARIAFVSAREAVEDSSIFDGNGTCSIEQTKRRVGCGISGGFGGLSTIEDACLRIKETGSISRIKPPLLARSTLPSTAASTISEHYQLHNGNAPSVETACTSGLVMTNYGFDKIQLGRADAYIVGGTGDLSLLTIGSFDTIGALTRNQDPKTASRPFDRERDGFVLGDGAACIVIEELSHALKRGAHIYSEVMGYGETQDAGHPTQPDDKGEFAGEAIIEALKLSRIKADDIEYINAHGTSTEINDRVETMVYKKIFGEHAYSLLVSSTKGATAHTLNAAGSLEIAITAMAIDRGVIPLTRGCLNPDREYGCDLDYVLGCSREARINTAMSVNFGFGGKNSAIVLRKYPGY